MLNDNDWYETLVPPLDLEIHSLLKRVKFLTREQEKNWKACEKSYANYRNGRRGKLINGKYAYEVYHHKALEITRELARTQDALARAQKIRNALLKLL